MRGEEYRKKQSMKVASVKPSSTLHDEKHMNPMELNHALCFDAAGNEQEGFDVQCNPARHPQQRHRARRRLWKSGCAIPGVLCLDQMGGELNMHPILDRFRTVQKAEEHLTRT